MKNCLQEYQQYLVMENKRKNAKIQNGGYMIGGILKEKLLGGRIGIMNGSNMAEMITNNGVKLQGKSLIKSKSCIKRKNNRSQILLHRDMTIPNIVIGDGKER